MHSFKDRLGRQWNIELTPEIVDVLKLFGIDLSSAAKLESVLDNNAHKMVRVIVCAIGPQIERAGIKPEAWLESVGDIETAGAAVAFLREWAALMKQQSKLNDWIEISRAADFFAAMIRKLQRARKYKVG